jgi:hypothetical protein
MVELSDTCTIGNMTRSRGIFALIVLVLIALLIGINRIETKQLQLEAQPYPKLLADLRPERWPERFPTLSNSAIIEHQFNGELSWVFTTPDDYFLTAVEIFDSFQESGFRGKRVISLSDSTMIASSDSGDFVVVRIDQLSHPQAPDRWTIIRITYVEPPQKSDRSELENQA